MGEWYDRPDKPAELDKLDIFTGEWNSFDVHQPMEWMKDGGTGTTQELFTRALDGYCFITNLEAATPFGSVKGHGFTFYDSSAKCYRLEWYDNFGNHVTGEGAFINDTTYCVIEKYTMNGIAVTERHTDKLISDNEKIHTIETLINGSYKPTSESHYKKTVI